MLGILGEDVTLPLGSGAQHRNVSYASITLGARVGTKAKRAQSVVLRAQEHPRELALLMEIVRVTQADRPLFPYSLEQYRKYIKLYQSRLGLPIGWTPHSPRAGYASEASAEGVPFGTIKEVGRWLSDSSLRIYIDVISAADITTKLDRAGLSQAVESAYVRLADFFPQGCFK